MINLGIKEIKRYLKLKNVIGSESDAYSKDMDNLIIYLNQLAKLKCYHIKRTKYFGESQENIKYNIVSTYRRNGQYTITFDYSVFGYIQKFFLLSDSSIKEILLYWMNKFNKENITSINISSNFSRKMFIKLNSN